MGPTAATAMTVGSRFRSRSYHRRPIAHANNGRYVVIDIAANCGPTISWSGLLRSRQRGRDIAKGEGHGHGDPEDPGPVEKCRTSGLPIKRSSWKRLELRRRDRRRLSIKLATRQKSRRVYWDPLARLEVWRGWPTLLLKVELRKPVISAKYLVYVSVARPASRSTCERPWRWCCSAELSSRRSQLHSSGVFSVASRSPGRTGTSGLRREPREVPDHRHVFVKTSATALSLATYSPKDM